MSTHEAAHRLAAFLNELGTEGVHVEAGAFGVLCLSTDADGYVGHVWPPDVSPPDGKRAAWRVETL